MKPNTFKKMTLCAALLGFPVMALAQNDPFSGDGGVDANVPAGQAQTIKVVFEAFSLPMREAAALQRAGLSDTAFYGELVKGLEDDSVKQESFLMARGIEGQKFLAEQKQEKIFPTEYDPPLLPNMVSGTGLVKGKKGEVVPAFPVTPSNPTSYETKNVGALLEAEVTPGQEGRIEIRLAPSQVTFLQRDVFGQGTATIEIPRFANQRIQTGIFARSGKPVYLGTMSPPIELQPKKGETRVWFSFVTATIVSL
jgi:hypothetical protein